LATWNERTLPSRLTREKTAGNGWSVETGTP
jgi:hypothetical protein